MEKIHFTVFSQAYYVDAVWGFGCPSGGIRNMGDLFHKYKIPITWLVSPRSARCEKDLFTEYHEKYGDEIAMMFRFEIPAFAHTKERDVAEKLTIEEYREMIRRQKEKIEEYLPWADIKIIGQGIRTENFIKAAEQEGFLGIYGHCYAQIGTDSITDFGMPWGSFPLRPGTVHLPAIKDQGLIAFEWTMRDLNKSLHTCHPELWSTDPNDVERGGVCTDENVEYWKNLYLEYEKALEYNKHGIWFQFHQEAHEQTWGEICKPMTQERVEFCTKMMDNFFKWLSGRESVNFITATEAARLYREKMKEGTIPMYVPYSWLPVEDHLPFWDQVRNRTGYSGSIHKNAHLPNERLYEYLIEVNSGDPIKAMKMPPWMDSFFYYDGECQLVFDKNITEPIALFNYLNYEPDPELLEEEERGGGAPGFFLEEYVPEAKLSIDPSNHPPIQIQINNKYEKDLPYGIFLWKEKYPVEKFMKSGVKFSREEETLKSKIIKHQGIFIRITLHPGENIITGS